MQKLIDDLLSVRNDLCGIFGDTEGERAVALGMLAATMDKLDGAIAELLRVDVRDPKNEAPPVSNISLAAIMGDDDGCRADVLDRIARGETQFTIGGGAAPAFEIRRVP